MEIVKAEKLAKELMAKHLGSSWHFQFDKGLRRFGCCWYSRKRITLSKKLVQLNEEAQVKDTILHEIAHALVGENHGHDNTWKRACVLIGAKPNRYYDSKVVQMPYKYVLVCPVCGHKHYMLRETKSRYACGHCCKGRFDPKYVLVRQEI